MYILYKEEVIKNSWLNHLSYNGHKTNEKLYKDGYSKNSTFSNKKKKKVNLCLIVTQRVLLTSPH